MKIPQKIKRRGKEYEFVKKYTNFVLYKESKTGIKECFSFFELNITNEN